MIFSCQEIKALFDLDCVSLLKVPVCLQFGPFGSGWPFGRFACPETKLYLGYYDPVIRANTLEAAVCFTVLYGVSPFPFANNEVDLGPLLVHI